MTLREWKEVLHPIEIMALEDFGYNEAVYGEQEISRGTVFEAIVKWHGGIATAYQIKSIISRVYGLEL